MIFGIATKIACVAVVGMNFLKVKGIINGAVILY